MNDGMNDEFVCPVCGTPFDPSTTYDGDRSNPAGFIRKYCSAHCNKVAKKTRGRDAKQAEDKRAVLSFLGHHRSEHGRWPSWEEARRGLEAAAGMSNLRQRQIFKAMIEDDGIISGGRFGPQLTIHRKQPFFVPGEVVSAFVHNVAVPRTVARPAVLVYQRYDGSWAVAGLTTASHYGSGEPRVPIPDWELIPLKRLGYLWGPRLPTLPPDDVRHHLGWAPPSLRLAICRLSDGLEKSLPDEAATFLSTPPEPDGMRRPDRLRAQSSLTKAGLIDA